MVKLLGIICALSLLVAPGSLGAQELLNNTTLVTGEILEVISEREEVLFDSENTFKVQTVRVEITEGSEAGRIIEFDNDYIMVKPGEKVFLNHHRDIGGSESFSIRDIDRRGWMVGLFLLFVVVIVVFSGKQGVRSLISLVLSILVIVYLLIPGILAGYNPAVLSTLLAALILFFAVFFTHGFNRESAVAFLGTVSAVVITGFLAWGSVVLLRLTGFASDESVYLNLNTAGAIDFKGLLLGAILIGVLGVLDDIAITQASVVSQLKSLDDKLSPMELYHKAVVVGKDHVGALVNTLALAYVGTSLPLLLLFANADASIWININSEIFATEVVRTLVGSIGLVLTVPITTLLAVYLIKEGKKGSVHSHAGHGGHHH